MATPKPEELPQLGRYQVIQKIAAGGMAEVYLAKAVGAMGFQRLVAVKLIHANFTRDPEFVKMFIDEAKIAMHLHHRNIVQVFDLDQASDTYFIAMEFVHGVNLYDLYERLASKQRWIEPSMALYLVAEVSKGLHFAHTRRGPDGRPLGIVHRDISPQNVLLSFEGEVKITDFGIATAAERLHQTAAGIVKGKYAYMAPERLQELPSDGRVDVFAVGVLMYEMLVGENPFAGSSAVDTIENVLNKRIPPPSERGAPVSHALDRIVMKALARKPDERFRSAQELADAVTEYALELTQARRDMAAGDGAVAALLAELFPEKQKRPLMSGEGRGNLNLPLGHGGVKVSTVDTSPDPPASDPRRAPPKKPNGRAEEPPPEPGRRSSVRDPAGGEPEEPTVLRMTPLGEKEALGLPRVSSGKPQDDEDTFTTPAEIGVPEDLMGPPTMEESGDKTAPTELPPSMMPPVKKPTVSPPTPDPAENDYAFAATLQSANALDTLAEDEPAGMPPPVVIRPPDARAPRGAARPEVKPAPPAARPGAPSAREIRERAAPPEPGAPPPRGLHVEPPQPQYTPPQYTPPQYTPPQAYPTPQGHGQPPGLSPYGGQPVPDTSGSNPMVVPVSSAELAYPKPGFFAQKTTTIAVFLLVLAALVAVAALLVSRDRSTQIGPSPSAMVPLTVTSTPSGALVIIDGKEVGPTPLKSSVQANADHTVTARLAGFNEAPPKRIRPPEGVTANLHLLLDPQKGSITVQTTPPDAQVFLNGQARGTGNVPLSDLPLFTELMLRIEAKGHRSLEQRITLTAEAPDLIMPIKLETGRDPPRAAPAKRRKITLATEFEHYVLVYDLSQGDPGKGRYIGTTPFSAELPIGEVKLRIVNEAQSVDRVIPIQVKESGPDTITVPAR